MNIAVSIVGPEALADLVALRLVWHPASNSDEQAQLDVEFRDWFEKESGRRVFFLALDDDLPIGMVNLVLFDRMPVVGRSAGGWGYLSNMFVLERYRDRGVGQQLLAAFKTHADGLGLERIVLKPTERSIPFYGRHGFGAQNELMVRQLPQSRS